MAKFCTQCGRALNEGEVCNCTNGTQNSRQFYQGNNYRNVSNGLTWEAVKNHMGIGDPEMNKTDAFETGCSIVPDCVRACEGEESIKQYEIANFRTRLFIFNIARAIGKIQITNKRLIFRAPGKTLLGRTATQQEFSINDISGIETHRGKVLNLIDLFVGMIVAALGVAIGTMFVTALSNSSRGFAMFLCYALLIAGCVPFVMLHKKWLVKILCLGAAYGPAMTVARALGHYSYYGGSDMLEFFGMLAFILSWIPFICTIFSVVVYSIIPSLSLVVKTSQAVNAVVIKHRKLGFAEIIPTEDAEKCFREINAIINEIQAKNSK